MTNDATIARYTIPAEMAAFIASQGSVAAQYTAAVERLAKASDIQGRFGLTNAQTAPVAAALVVIVSDLRNAIAPAAAEFATLAAEFAMDTAWSKATKATALGFTYGQSQTLLAIA